MFILRHALMAAALSTAALSFSAAAEPSADLIAKAKQEGRVTYYTDLIIDQVVRPLAAAFEAKYGIKVDYARGDSQDNVLKAINETKAGRPVGDMVSLTTGVHSLIEGGVTRPYTSPDVMALAPVYRDATNFWVSPYYYVMAPGINTTLVKAEDRPKTYDDLLLPKWKGKMVWKPNDTSGAPGFIGNILTSMGEERGMAYLQRLAGQNITVVHASARAILDQVIAGEYPMALQIFNHHTVLSAAKGAPSDWIPLSPATVTVGQVTLVKGSPHPHAAELLLEFLISKEGQQIFQKAGYFPTHPEVPAPWPELSPSGGRFTPNVIGPDIIARDLEKWNDIFKRLFR
jgi:ABC-type Fe3+ transport system substrate-binding protein